MEPEAALTFLHLTTYETYPSPDEFNQFPDLELISSVLSEIWIFF